MKNKKVNKRKIEYIDSLKDGVFTRLVPRLASFEYKRERLGITITDILIAQNLVDGKIRINKDNKEKYVREILRYEEIIKQFNITKKINSKGK